MQIPSAVIVEPEFLVKEQTLMTNVTDAVGLGKTRNGASAGNCCYAAADVLSILWLQVLKSITIRT
jgi:hypothetical protein